MTGNDGADLAEAERRVDARGLRVIEQNPTEFVTSFPFVMLAPPGFSKRKDDSKVRTYSHEFVHYCELDAMGFQVYLETFMTSDGRVRMETPAWGQTLITHSLQGATFSDGDLSNLAATVRDKYWLWDIDPAQYEAQIPKIWRSMLDAYAWAPVP